MNANILQQRITEFQTTWCKSKNPDNQLRMLTDMASVLGLHLEFKLTPNEELESKANEVANEPETD